MLTFDCRCAKVIDVEGAEHHVLATDFLPKPLPRAILMEAVNYKVPPGLNKSVVTDGPKHLSRIHNMLQSSGYVKTKYTPRHSQSPEWKLDELWIGHSQSQHTNLVSSRKTSSPWCPRR